MATKLTTSYQQIGYIVPIGSGTNNETRVHLYARISSQNASGATIEARATIDLRYSGFSTSNGQLNLTGTTSGWSQTGSVTPTNYYVNGSWSLSRSQSSYAEVYAVSKTMTRTNANNSFSLGLHFKIVTNSQTYEASTGNVDLYFVPQAPTTWTVSYNANGGTGAPAAQTKTKDVALTLSSTIPTRASQTTTGATVTFNDDWGTPSYNTYTTVGATVSYTFANWNTASDGSGTSYSAGGSYTANEPATLYAQWTTSQTADGTVKLPTSSPGNLGSFKYFAGWTTTKGNLNTRVQDGFVATSNMTVYAYWADVNSKFKYKNNGSWEIL